MHMDFTQILYTPVQTEKAVRGHTEGQYTFYISSEVNKFQVKHAVKELYGVSPKAVRIVSLPSKTTGQGRLKRKAFRKAIIILKKGDTIDPIKFKK